MSDRLRLRRHLYEQAGLNRRGRRARRRQIRLLDMMSFGFGPGPASGPDDGSAGVREPRRPYPSAGPAARVAQP